MLEMLLPHPRTISLLSPLVKGGVSSSKNSFLASSVLTKEHVALPTGGLPQEIWDFGDDQLHHPWLSLHSAVSKDFPLQSHVAVTTVCSEVVTLPTLPICRPFDLNSRCSGATQSSGLALILPLLTCEDVEVRKRGLKVGLFRKTKKKVEKFSPVPLP